MRLQKRKGQAANPCCGALLRLHALLADCYEKRRPFLCQLQARLLTFPSGPTFPRCRLTLGRLRRSRGRQRAHHDPWARGRGPQRLWGRDRH